MRCLNLVGEPTRFVSTAKGMDEPCWFDDPIFDDVKEKVDGNMLCGDEWRRCMQVKQEKRNVQVLSVAGVTFKVAELERAVKKGARRVELVPEPTNKYDSEAVKIVIDDEHVGYIPRAKRLKSLDQTAHVLKCSAAPPHVVLAIA